MDNYSLFIIYYLIMAIGNRFNKFIGKTRFVVSRIFIHLQGQEISSLLGILNKNARDAIAAEGEIEVMGECLVNICQGLLEYQTYWQSAANEGDVFWQEEDAGDCIADLFTDSASRYLSQTDFSADSDENALSLPTTDNVIVMITVAFTGEIPEIETDLAQLESLTNGLKALMSIYYKQEYKAIAIHFSPAQLGDVLTSEQTIMNFPELIPL